MIEKLETLLWFVCRPSHWAHAVELGLRKARPDRDCPPRALEAREWAAARAVTAQSALSAIGVLAPGEDIPELPPDLLAEGNARAQQSRVRMGGLAIWRCCTPLCSCPVPDGWWRPGLRTAGPVLPSWLPWIFGMIGA